MDINTAENRQHIARAYAGLYGSWPDITKFSIRRNPENHRSVIATDVNNHQMTWFYDLHSNCWEPWEAVENFAQ